MEDEKKTRHEYLDPTPMAIPVKFLRPSTEAQRVRALVQSAISAMASDQGFETFEESDDFDIGDDYDPTSPYEYSLDDEHSFRQAYALAREQIDPETGEVRPQSQTDGGQVGSPAQHGSNGDPAA